TSSVSAVATFATVFRSISMVSGLLTVAEAYGVHMTPGDVLSTLKQANAERSDVAKTVVRDHIRAELPSTKPRRTQRVTARRCAPSWQRSATPSRSHCGT